MKYVSRDYCYLEELGFKDRCSYWEKELAYDEFIRVRCDNDEVGFFVLDDYGNYTKFDACVPIWAFTTIVNMINKGLIE